MPTRIKQWLGPPEFPGDEEKTARARIINTAGLYYALTLITGAVVLVPFFVSHKIASWAIILALAVAYGISRVLLFRGRLALAVVLLIASAWAMGLGVSMLGGGIASPMLYVVFAGTIFIGFLLEPRAGAGFVLATTLVALGLAILQQNGINPPQIFVFSPMATWAMFALALWFVHAVMALIVQHLRGALARARQENGARLEAEATLRESERKFRSITENIPGMVYQLRVRGDGSSYFSYVSPRVTELYGLPVDPQSPDWELGALAYPDDRESLLTSVTQSIADRTNWDHEWRIVTRTGDIMYCQGISSPRQIGDELAFDGVILDITKRKRAEQALRQALDIVENIQVGLHIYHLEDMDDDRTLRMVYANPASDEFTGVRAVDVVGKTLDENFPGLRQFGIPQRYAEVARRRTPCELGDVLYGDERVRKAAFSVKAFPLPDQHVGVSFEDITGRKQAEEALQESEERYRTLFERANDGIFLMRQDQIVDCNPAAEKVFGRSRRELIGISPADISPAQQRDGQDSKEKAQEKVKGALAGNPQYFEWVHTRPDGSLFDVEVSVSRVHLDGEWLVLSLVRDITERKQAEEALWQQAQIIDQIHDSVIATDLEGVITAWNRGSERLFGYTADQAIGQHVALIYPREGHGYLRDELIAGLKARGALEAEPQMQRQSGERFDAHVSLSLVRNRDEEITGMIGYTLDITERKRAEAALRENQHFIESVMRAMPDIIYIYDLQTRRSVYSSRSIPAMLGYRPEEIQATGDAFLSQLLHPGDIEQLPALWARWDTAQDNEILTSEYRMRTKHGEWHWFLGRNMVFQRGPDGRVQQFVGTIQDITERKRMEHTLQRYTNRLATLHALDQAILAAESPKATVEAALGHLWGPIPCQYAWVVEVDLPTRMSHYIAGQARDGTILRRKEKMPIISDRHIELIKEQDFVAFHDAADFDPDNVIARLMREHSACTVYFFRLMAGEKILGLLGLALTAKNELLAEEIEILREVVNSLAIALHQARMHAQIQEDAQVKTHLLREVNHRVSNNLMAITGLLRTERRYAPPEYAQVIDDTLTRLIRRVEGLTEVHRLLSETQWMPVNLSQLASHIIHKALNALPTDQMVKARVIPSTITVSPRQASNLALILNELTTNTIKYGLLQHGAEPRTQSSIDVRIAETEEGMVMLEYRDDGPGYPEPVLRLEEVDVGLYLIQQLALTLQGTLALANRDGAATTLIFEPEEKNRT